MKSLMTFALVTCLSAIVQAAIPQLKQKDFTSLVKAAQNTSLTLTERWQSLVQAGAIAEPDQIEKIVQFSKSPEWFMRNAALVSLEGVYGGDDAIEQAKILIKDKALVVRSAAVNTLSKKNTLEVKQLFAVELTKPYNFSGRQSLWIRSQMMEKITQLVTEDDRQFMARYLFDSDQKVAELSVEALEKISTIHFEGKNSVQLWQAYVKKSNWL